MKNKKGKNKVLPFSPTRSTPKAICFNFYSILSILYMNYCFFKELSDGLK